MKSYRLGRKARVDLREISLSIAKDSPQAALNWLKILNDRFAILARQPEMGERCDDLRAGLRRISVGNYVVYFEYGSGRLRIVRVLHGARDTTGLI
jgi:toxin ParE1/3/4